MNRSALSGLFLLLVYLSACSGNRLVESRPDRTREFTVCSAALDFPESKRAFQGLDGWFFFNHDLKEDYEMLAPEQANFIAKLSQAFATQGVQLVVVPVPGRAVVRPDELYSGDPKQTAFSPTAAKARYFDYINKLQHSGVAVVNVLAVAGNFDARGGQTFFKRDLHWTPEGANAVAEATAEKIHQIAANKPFPNIELTLTRNSQDQVHKGRFVNNWLYGACGYTLPPEPLGVYTVSRQQESIRLPTVVQAGSSFGGLPFDQGFLSVALQSEILNVSVGNGGALLALESYLATDDYKNNRPQILVWEYPTFWRSLAVSAQQKLLAAAHGICRGDAVYFEYTGTVNDEIVRATKLLPNADDHYLTLSFEDLSLLHFDITLYYQNGAKKTLTFDRPEQIAKRNQGRYFTMLPRTTASLEKARLGVPKSAAGNFTLQVCQNPQSLPPDKIRLLPASDQ